MRFLFNPSGKEMTLTAILYALFGLVLCFLHANILIWATRFVGLLILLCGLYFFYIYLFDKASILYGPLFSGSLCAMIGLFFILAPESVLSFLPIITGLVLIFNSFVQLRKSILLKQYGYEDWLFSMLASFLILAAGIIILLKPIQTLSFILKIIGVCLIFEAIVLLITKHKLKKYDLLD